MSRWYSGLLLALAAVVVGITATFAVAQPQGKDKIDFNVAKKLRQRSLKGEKLTKEEQEYLERAKAAFRKKSKSNPKSARPTPRPSIGVLPLTDMSAKDKYKGQSGGLYGRGQNDPPDEHLRAAMREVENIQPLDGDGKPSKNGKIVLLSNGMSNTTQEFRQFMTLANRDRQKSPNVTIVDGAQGGMDALAWAAPERIRKGRRNPWHVLDERIQKAGVTPQQIQVVWLKQARPGPASLGEFPKHAQEMQGHLVVVLHTLKERFPNLRIAYLSSRIYAGYATTALNPEPYAYESAFTMRWLIQDQIKGDPVLNYDPKKGKVNAPLLLWGPYLWADGVKGRKQDDLVWKREDLAGDGTHPSTSGRQKVAELLLKFFKTDPTAKVWFIQNDKD